jgi:hypothetical protein
MTMTEDQIEIENNLLQQRVKKCLDELAPHFDSVQIFAVRHVCEEIGTVRVIDGRGDFYSRLGVIKFWIKEQKL